MMEIVYIFISECYGNEKRHRSGYLDTTYIVIIIIPFIYIAHYNNYAIYAFDNFLLHSYTC